MKGEAIGQSDHKQQSRKTGPPVKQTESIISNHLCLFLNSHLNQNRIKMICVEDDSQQEMSKADLERKSKQTSDT